MAFINLSRGKQTIVDKERNQASIDNDTQNLGLIETEHKMIHEGKHFNIANYQKGLGSGDTIDFIFATPDSEELSHFKFMVNSSAGITLDLYRGATYDDTTGTVITPLNNNNNSTNTSGVDLRKNPTISSDGTFRLGFIAGANKQTGLIESREENTLLRNEVYLMRITSNNTGNNIGWKAEWYEN